MKKILSAITFSFITLATNLYADAYDWTGINIGAKAGYTNMDSKLENRVVGSQHYFNAYGDSIDLNDSSILGGIFIGAQKQYKNYLFGIELDHTFGDLEETKQMAGPFATNNFKVRMNNINSIAGKLGYAFDDNLIYAKLGYASAKFSSQADEIPSYNHIGVSNKRQSGYLIGLGFDKSLAKLNKNIILGIEYDHYQFNDKTQIGQDLSGYIPTYNVNIDPSFDSLMLKLSYKFN
jgi:opacity protein-like surface antigen